MLEVSNIHAGYGQLRILNGITFTVARGEVVAIAGPNGAGKSTLLNSMVGLIPRRGEIAVDGATVAQHDIPAALNRGIAIVAEDRQLFGDLSVEENLLMGSYSLLRRRRDGRRNKEIVARLREECDSVFPILVARKEQLAKTLSGGEQQMVAIARAVMSNPSVLLLDEPTLGLAPVIIESMLAALQRIAADRAVVIVEQDLGLITSLATRLLHLDEGVARAVSSSPSARPKSSASA